MAQRKPPWTHRTFLSRLLLTGFALLCCTFTRQAAPASDAAANKQDVEAQARAAHKSGRWLEAVRLYDDLLHGKEKPGAEVREAYQECLRRYYLQRRHGDRLYRDALAKLTYPDAVVVLDKVLETLSQSYVDPQKTELSALFKSGLHELLYALDEDAFTKQYLAIGDKKILEPLRQRLNELKAQKVVGSRREAADELLSLSRDARRLGLTRDVQRTFVVFAMEFACGACNALDEYSLYLTPFHLNALRGKYVGIGVDLAIIDHNLVISRVYPNSPAWDALQKNQLAVGDRVKRIDAQPVEDLPPDAVAERLLGESDTEIELELQTPGETKARTPFKLMRRPVTTTSVEHRLVGDSIMSAMPDVGYIRIYNFQDTTPQEIKEAIAQLQTAGIKGLILDLRGNPGGLFKAAVQVSELFLGEGAVIVFTQGQLKQFSKPYKVEGGNPFQGPMMVLVDGDTASSAEILAGALKDHGRAKLFGQPTFGKGSIQEIIPLERTAGGIRITVAKFLSPLKHGVSGTGIMPDVIVVDGDNDETYLKALDELRPLLGKMPMMR
jgi:carboxyl-terminal processing protease